MTRIETEICVIGGGPAGASMAQRLARLGHDVCLVERHAFPRPHVGEALTPGVWPLLEALGVVEEVRRAGFLPSIEAIVRWEEGLSRRVRAREDAPGLIVDRGRFDGLLLEAARAAGVNILQPATASRPVRLSHGWEVPVSRGAEALLISSRFLVDASGRAFVLGGSKSATSARTLALYGYWRSERVLGWETRVEAALDCWYWGAPLPDGTFNAMVFVDPELLRAYAVRRSGLETFYRERIGRSELLAGCVRPALSSPVIARDATCYADPEPIAEGFIKVGEAGFAIDPLSSAGVQKALQTALCGSSCVHTLLTRRGNADAARLFYLENQRSSVEQHAAWAAGYYREQRLHSAQPFWQRRAGTSPEPPAPEPEALPSEGLHERRVRTSRQTVLLDVPCLVGDVVEFKRAVSHPRLSRPVAYLGGVELAPLVEAIPEGVTVEALARSWGAHVPFERGLAIAGWLYRNGLLSLE